MSILGIDDQQFSEKTLKGFLLKNVDASSQNPHIKLLNEFLIGRVDAFWNDVVIPLQKLKQFDGNKINWYFDIYKEGHEARAAVKHPFSFVQVSTETVEEIVNFLSSKSLPEYIDLGPVFLAHCFNVLSLWSREQTVATRLKHIYNSQAPHEWILMAEKEERGIMSQKNNSVQGLDAVLGNIVLLMSRKV